MKYRGKLSLALIVATALGGCATQQSVVSDAGWQSLIKGGSGLENFNRVAEANWAARDGAIEASSGGKDAAYLVTTRPYGNFMIKSEFWASDDVNSGIFIRCADATKIAADTCYEVNIYDQRPDPSYGTGAIVGVAKVDPMPKAGGKWNTLEITAQGSHLVVVFNGKKTVDAQDSKRDAGYIALQWGAVGTIRFRNLQIKPL